MRTILFGMIFSFILCGCRLDGSAPDATPVADDSQSTAPVTPTIFVEAATSGGSDNNDCLSSSLTTAHGPCLTLARAFEVFLTYGLNGKNSNINIGCGTFQGAQFLGVIPGSAGSSSQYLVLNGAGTCTEITDQDSGVFVFAFSNGITAIVQNMTIAVPANEIGLYVQTSGTVLQLGKNLTFTGAGNSVAIHGEAYALIESAATNSISIDGSFSTVAAIGVTGYLEFEGGGKGKIVCASTLQPYTHFFIAQGNAEVDIGAGWTFSGCGTAEGSPYLVEDNANLLNLSGSTIPGNTAGTTASGGTYSTQ